MYWASQPRYTTLVSLVIYFYFLTLTSNVYAQVVNREDRGMLPEEYTAEKEVHKLYVRNLPYSVTEERLLHEFESRFEVIDVQIARDYNQMSRGTQPISGTQSRREQ